MSHGFDLHNLKWMFRLRICNSFFFLKVWNYSHAKLMCLALEGGWIVHYIWKLRRMQAQPRSFTFPNGQSHFPICTTERISSCLPSSILPPYCQWMCLARLSRELLAFSFFLFGMVFHQSTILECVPVVYLENANWQDGSFLECHKVSLRRH